MPGKKLLVFGDSHAIIWEGSEKTSARKALFPNVEVHHLGPALAYNLLENNDTLGKWGLRIFSDMQDAVNYDIDIGAVMLCFGEIDIRTQLAKRLAEGNSLKNVCTPPARKLELFAAKLARNFKVPVLIWEPIATTWQKETNPFWPIVGSESVRNNITLFFSNLLRTYAQDASHNVYSFGIAQQIIDGAFLTKREFYADDHHLNFKGLDLAIKAFGKLVSDNNIEGLDEAFLPGEING